MTFLSVAPFLFNNNAFWCEMGDRRETYAIENDVAMSRLNNLIRCCGTVRAEIFELPLSTLAAAPNHTAQLLKDPASVFHRAICTMFPGDWRVENHMSFFPSSAVG